MAKWVLKNSAQLTYTGIHKTLSPVILEILANRGITGNAAVDGFLDTDLAGCHSPWEMKDMDTAVTLIMQAIQDGKKIMAVGDYDADGIIGTYILYTGLLRLGADVRYRIPHRITDGYGINDAIIDETIDDKYGMLITCDNGISALSQIQNAVEAGITVIVTDHHDIPEILPPAHAIINPKQNGCAYPNKSLCGAGVAWKLVSALFERMEINPDEAGRYIEYAAIATVCDIVDLTGENRIIVKSGLKMIDETQNIGMKALIVESGLTGKPMTAYSLGFLIGPAINATGRLAHAKLALELLISDSTEKSTELAKELRRLNAERQVMTEKGLDQAVEDIYQKGREKDKVIVEYLPQIHESIAGIVAGRLKDKFNRPVFVLTDSKDGVKGSGRSIEAYDMNRNLAECAGLLMRFGGHPMAAGFTVKAENVNELRRWLNDVCELADRDFEKKVNIDMILPAGHMNKTLAADLMQLEPYGKGNPQPVFELKNVVLSGCSVVGKQGNVVKFTISTADGCHFNGIYFGNEQNGLFEYIDDSVEIDLAFNMKINEYRGMETLQLTVVDFKSANGMEK